MGGYNKPISSNIGPVQQNMLMHVAPIKNLDEVFFIGGDYTESYISHENDTRSKIIIAGDTQMIDQEQLVSYVGRMSQAHYKFFGDVNYINDYFVFLVGDSFPYIYTKTDNYQIVAINSALDNMAQQHVIAKLHLQKWLGQLIQSLRQNQSESSWLINDGLIDYYVAYLNYKVGIWAVQDYLNNYNECLYRYFSSPMSLATNDELNRYKLGSSVILDLRTRILAHKLDYELKVATDSKFNLDSYIKYLIHTANHDANFVFSTQTLEDTILDIAGYNISTFLKENVMHSDQNIVNNNMLITSILGDEAMLDTHEVEAIDYAMDLRKSMATGYVEQLQTGSNAYNAGLRNGYQIVGYWMPAGNKDQKDQLVGFRVKGPNNNVFGVRFKPSYQKIKVPKYLIRE